MTKDEEACLQEMMGIAGERVLLEAKEEALLKQFENEGYTRDEVEELLARYSKADIEAELFGRKNVEKNI